ncbi:MAG TPA: hypothetical protein P5568_13265 [Acidobacteriota bacterium]|nr:hypothetical protein [Acidobacteriota bacterium]
MTVANGPTESAAGAAAQGRSTPSPAGRIAKYTLAAVLLLSLPTFSEFLPHRLAEELPDSPVSHPEAGFVTRLEAPTGGETASFASGARFLRGGVLSRGRSGGVRNTSQRVARQLGSDASAVRNLGDSSSPVRPRGRNRFSSQVDAPLPGRMEAELSAMEADYQVALQNYFPDGTGSLGVNPFADVLWGRGGVESTPSGDNSGGEGDGGQGGTGGGDGGGSSGGGGNGGSGGEGGGGDGGGGGGGGSGPGGDAGGGGDAGQPPVDVDNLSERFLVILPSGSQFVPPTMTAATRTSAGNFELDVGGTLMLFSGIVGTNRATMYVDEGQQVVSGPATSGVGVPFLLFGRSSFGSAVQSWRLLNGLLQPWWSYLFYYDLLYSAALFDIDGDDREELVAAESRSENLVVYEIAPDGLQYKRELMVPFRPMYLVRTDSKEGVPTRYLQVFNERLSRSVTFSDRYPPGTYSHAAPLSKVADGSVIVQAESGERFREYRVLLYRDHVVLFWKQGQDWTLVASLHFGAESPVVVVGDYYRNGRHTAVVLP